MNRCYTIGVITFVITFIIFYFFIYKNDEKRVSEHFDEEDKARFGNLITDFQNALLDYVTKQIPQEKRQNLQKEIIKFVNSFTNPASEYGKKAVKGELWLTAAAAAAAAGDASAWRRAEAGLRSDRLYSRITRGLNISFNKESSNELGDQQYSQEMDNIFKDLNPSQILYKDNDELDNNSRYINKSELTIMINEYVEKLEENFPALHIIVMDFINKNTPKTYS